MSTLRAKIHPSMLRRSRLGLIALSVFVAMIPANVQSSDVAQQQLLVDKAKLTLEAFAAEPDLKDSLRILRHETQALFIVPQFIRGAYVFGGAGGSGVLLVRDEKTGEWSQPVFYNIGSASFGLQIGADVSEIVLVVRTRKGLEEFYRHDFKLGGNVGVALGPIGGSASFHDITADMLAYAKSKGAFIGMALEGAIVTVSDESNAAYYGRAVRPTDIIVKGDVKNEKSVPLLDSLAKLMK